MLSIFWFSVSLLFIWFCFFKSLINDIQQYYFLSGLSALVVITILSWNWIFSGWYNFIFSLLPVDNLTLMNITTWLILAICLFFIFFTPSIILARVFNEIKNRNVNFYEIGKQDGFNNKKPAFQNNKYISGYRDGIKSIKDKELDSYK